MHFRFMDVILLHSGHQQVSAACGHLQGGETRHSGVIEMCLHHSTV
jgi:hypothetical protein